VNALGHAHPRIVKTIREQAGKLIHVSNLYYHEYQGALAEKLVTLLGSSFGNARAFFSNSGTEAIEGSIKLARLAGHRAGGEAKSRLVALEGSYHGRTFGALSLTGQEKHRKGFEPMLEDVTFVRQNDVEGLRAAVNDSTCAIVLEPIFGEGGIHECSVEFLQACRAAADRHRAALIFDEIQCGLRLPSRLRRGCLWERLSPGKNLLTRFRRGSMGLLLAEGLWLAGLLWSFLPSWKKRSCSTM
jgi:acetylornithine/N-succinyldiaminopimelate aminotransferase